MEKVYIVMKEMNNHVWVDKVFGNHHEALLYVDEKNSVLQRDGIDPDNCSFFLLVEKVN
jgi:hypothetical protein